MGFFSKKSKTNDGKVDEKLTANNNDNKDVKDNVNLNELPQVDDYIKPTVSNENEVFDEIKQEAQKLITESAKKEKVVQDNIKKKKQSVMEKAGAIEEEKIEITDKTVKQNKQVKGILKDKKVFNNDEDDLINQEYENKENISVKSGSKKNNNIKKNNILETLIERCVLTKDQVQVAETQALKTGDSVIDVLVRLNFVSESVIHNIFENNTGEKDKIVLSEMVPDMKLINKIPISFALEHKVMPLYVKDNKIFIATSNPYDIVLLEQLSSLFDGKEVETIAYSEQELIVAIDKFYKGNVVANLSDILSEMELNVDKVKTENLDKENTPVVKFINALLYEAIRINASDIHIEPDEMFLRIRMRIDGVLKNITIIHKNYWSGICVRIKVLACMNIAESRKPQDGGMKMTIQGREIDFRVSTIPTLYGENIVIRILDKAQGLLKLEELGFNKSNLKLLNLALKKPEGIIIVTGPTGSGKTTTLYSILSLINDVGDNIMTLEDPVEYRLPMIRQSEINHRSGFDFSSGLRSILRQDPDVIFLGEIRDQETAEIAVRASITGHKVFSTLHTNSALSAITRLIDIGIQSYMLSDSLTCVVAQRLVRCLCEECKKQETMSDEMKKAFALPDNKNYTIYSATGCEKCHQTGYKGRCVISEVLFIDPELKDIIANNPTIKTITDEAKKKGFMPMQRDAILKLLKGLTSWDEVQRVVDMTEYSKKLS